MSAINPAIDNHKENQSHGMNSSHFKRWNFFKYVKHGLTLKLYPLFLQFVKASGLMTPDITNDDKDIFNIGCLDCHLGNLLPLMGELFCLYFKICNISGFLWQNFHSFFGVCKLG